MNRASVKYQKPAAISGGVALAAYAFGPAAEAGFKFLIVRVYLPRMRSVIGYEVTNLPCFTVLHNHILLHHFVELFICYLSFTP